MDLYDPDEVCTAGDYARAARRSLAEITARGALPIVAGGTGLYLRALLEGLAPAPQRDPGLRDLLRVRVERRGAGSLHRTLGRFDPVAAGLIHANDTPKLIRAIEVSVLRRRPMTEQWSAGRDALTGYRVLRIGLRPARAVLYGRINERAERMFRAGLVEETRGLIARFGPECRPFTSLGYAEAAAVLRGEMSEAEAITAVQQGHRNFAKRQGTWFRREGELHAVEWLDGVGDDPRVQAWAVAKVRDWVGSSPSQVSEARPGDPIR